MNQFITHNQFITYNQFDKRFSIFEKFGSDRTACPLFGLITCYNFMINGDISQKMHERNIFSAITNYTVKELPKYMMFDELVLLTNGSLKPNDINATTPELLVSNIVGYEHMFKFGYGQNYCILLLKGRNFIAILYKYTPEEEIYAVRDCHENTQMNFHDFESLRIFLNNTYQFEQQTIVGGIRIPEFENMEFLTIDYQFELLNIDCNLVDDVYETNKLNEYNDEKCNSINENNKYKKIGEELDQYIALSLIEDENCEDYVNFI